MFIVIDISCAVVVHVKVKKKWCRRHLRRLCNKGYVKGHRNFEVS